MTTEQVSVIIPCYRQAQYLAESIDSALRQTYPAVQVVVVNDGSPDETSEVCRNYAGKIVYIEQSNQGRSAARNAGVKASTGDWLQFLDADDLIHPNKIEWQLADMARHKARVGYCCTVNFDTSPFDKPHPCRYFGQVDDMASSLVTLSLGTPVPIHSVLMRREIFDAQGGFEQNVEIDEDRRFFMSIAMTGERFHFTPIVGAYYRYHSESTNSNQRGIFASNLQFLREVWQLTLEGKLNPATIKPVLRDSLFVLANNYAKTGGSWKDIRAAYEFSFDITGPGPRWQSLQAFLPRSMVRLLWLNRQRWQL